MPYVDPIQQKQAQHESYERNRSRVAERSRIKRAADRAWLDTQKDEPCVDCGGRFPPCVMDFHHHVPDHKVKAVSWLMLNAGRQRVIDEIAKCILLCANCHRLREYGNLR